MMNFNIICTLINTMIFLFIASFVGDFVIAIIIVNLILFYLARGLFSFPIARLEIFEYRLNVKFVKWILEGR